MNAGVAVRGGKSVEVIRRIILMIRSLDRRAAVLFFSGAVFALAVGLVSFAGLEFSSETSFCMSCHEMRLVGEQGWMRSSHFANDRGVAADCRSCHIPPEPVPLLWTKARDGMKDVYVHMVGVSNPDRMDWGKLGRSARRKISDSACRSCHENLTPAGGSLKMILAHREYERLEGRKRCLACHTREFHGEFKMFLSLRPGRDEGGAP